VAAFIEFGIRMKNIAIITVMRDRKNIVIPAKAGIQSKFVPHDHKKRHIRIENIK